MDMSKNITKFCEICQIQIEEVGIFHLLDNGCKLKLLHLLPEIDLDLTQNSIICDQCFTQITDTQEFKQFEIKDEGNIDNLLPQDLPKEPDAVNDNTIYVKEEPGVENIKEEFNVGMIKDEVLELQVMQVDFCVYIDKKNSTEMYYCCACGCCTDTKLKLIQHIHKQHRKRDLIYHCDKCDYKSAYRSRLEPHILSQHSGESDRKDNLRQHKLTHTNGKLYKCTQCKFDCNIISKLKEHMSKHTGEYPFQCNECDYKCGYKSHLKLHILSKHTNEKPYRCDKCDYKSCRRATLKQHQLIHTNRILYRCTHCKYGCNGILKLKQHMVKHTGEYPFQCDKCDYKSVYKSTFKNHILSQHGTEKPYQCDNCDYKCVRRSSLKRHELTHTNEKPFKCNQCNYASKQPEGLKIHMYKHTGEKPYHCNKCDFKCFHRSSLKYHKSTHQ